MLNRILAIAVVAGAVAGIAVSGLQMVWTAPLILDAEFYEKGVAQAHGLDRGLWTLLANIVTGVGAALILAAAFSLRSDINLRIGLGFGAAAFAAFGLAPALGLLPELPGTLAADLGARQTWWAGTAFATLAGLALIVYGRRAWLKAGGVLVLAVPHLIGAPQPEFHEALAPLELQQRFIAASLFTSLAFWLLLGGVTGLLSRRFHTAGPAPRAS